MESALFLLKFWESLREHLGDDVSVDVGETIVAALESVGELLVVDAETVQQSGL